MRLSHEAAIANFRRCQAWTLHMRIVVVRACCVRCEMEECEIQMSSESCCLTTSRWKGMRQFRGRLVVSLFRREILYARVGRRESRDGGFSRPESESRPPILEQQTTSIPPGSICMMAALSGNKTAHFKWITER